MYKFVIIACVFVITSCGRNTAPRTSVYEVGGSNTQRVAGVSAILCKHKVPPTAILDAHLLEEQIGDGELGPSDFRTFYLVKIAPQDISNWAQVLTPLGTTPEYNAPLQPRDWWVTRETFALLQFYKPETLTGRPYGWIGISRQTGHIFVFTFTM